jgi:hypothetical protein
MESHIDEANEYAESFAGLTSADAAFYALFAGVIKAPAVPFGLKGAPYVMIKWSRHYTKSRVGQDSSTWLIWKRQSTMIF